jgi:hypothetical protein
MTNNSKSCENNNFINKYYSLACLMSLALTKTSLANNRLIWKFTTICKSIHHKAVVGLGGLPAAFLGCPTIE